MTASLDTNEQASQSIVHRPSMRSIYISFAIYFLALFATVMPPLFGYVNRVEPFYFGLPFFLFWILFVSIMMSLGLMGLYWIEKVRGELV